MPVAEETTLQISCDNSSCPGNQLDPAERTGWLFITSEVYGQPTNSHVYCCSDCAAADANVFAPAMPMP
jgi:hypothetical protein